MKPQEQTRTPSIQELLNARRRYGRDFAALIRKASSGERPKPQPEPAVDEGQEIFELDGPYLQSLLKQTEKAKR